MPTKGNRTIRLTIVANGNLDGADLQKQDSLMQLLTDVTVSLSKTKRKTRKSFRMLNPDKHMHTHSLFSICIIIVIKLTNVRLPIFRGKTSPAIKCLQIKIIGPWAGGAEGDGESRRRVAAW